jgi:hydrogenase maturation protein HypF
LKKKSKKTILGLGGELNNTSCILTGNKAFMSQHIGDVENIETKTFLEKSTNHLIRLTNTKIDIIACDMHPKFTTTNLAKELSIKNGWKLIQVQHHYAHIAALLMENSIDDIVGIICDGYGYGFNAEAWGGEILFSTLDSKKIERIGHLEKQPLLGGDQATRYPIRIAAGILNKEIDISKWLLRNSRYLPHGEKEANLIVDQLKKRINIVETTSCGRILDAAAAILGICYFRGYEGEPAIRLESISINGKDVLHIEPRIKNNIIQTTPLLLEVFLNKNRHTKKDLAYSVHSYLARSFAQLAIEKASQKDTKNIGFSGGVACNKIFSELIKKNVQSKNFRFITHNQVPPGDGGVAFGQSVIGGFFSFIP